MKRDESVVTLAGRKAPVIRGAGLAVLVLAACALSACGDKAKKPGQSLASVDGTEITVLQLNDEMERAAVPAERQAQASKQLLEALIDRQLLENAAAKEKLDRDPKVLQAIERARSQVVVQSYMQKRLASVAKPTAAEIADYYQANPGFFRDRKQFDLRELILASKDIDDKVKAAMDSAKSLDDLAAWLGAQKIAFGRTQVSRTTSDLPPDMSAKLVAMPKGQIFLVSEGARSLLITVAEVKDNPVTLEVAGSQIGQFLLNKRNKEASDAEVARLRAAAKVEYLNAATGPAAPAPAPAAGQAAPAAGQPAAAAPGEAAAPSESAVAGLK